MHSTVGALNLSAEYFPLCKPMTQRELLRVVEQSGDSLARRLRGGIEELLANDLAVAQRKEGGLFHLHPLA